MRLGFVNTSVQETYMMLRLKGLTGTEAWNEVECKLRGQVPDDIKTLAETEYSNSVNSLSWLYTSMVNIK